MTRQNGEAPVTCATPIEHAVLMDYWLALLPAVEEDAVEEHLFGCDDCGDRLRETIELSEGLRSLARSGSLRVVVGDGLVQHAVDAGLRVREYAFAPGQTVACTVSVDDELLVARLAADLSGAARVDLSFCDPLGVERQRMTDIPVGSEAGSVLLQESLTFAKGSPSMTMIARLLAIDPKGDERLLGEYTFQHTRTIPGPSEWEW
jgi:Putative zinc-finger